MNDSSPEYGKLSRIKNGSFAATLWAEIIAQLELKCAVGANAQGYDKPFVSEDQVSATQAKCDMLVKKQ